MRIPGLSIGLSLAIAVVVSALPAPPAATLVERCNSTCSRGSLTIIITQILDSMVAHNPYTLPMAPVYKATENSHAAALGMMTSWRTITKAGEPNLLALDTTQCSGYFALDISEGNDAVPTILRGRVKVVDNQISELELFINRNRGDHGFSFSAAELPGNYAVLMSPPDNRTKASRETLLELSEALFAVSSDFSVSVADECQFTELGWAVVDPGPSGNLSTARLNCSWPDAHPTDVNARVGLVIDEELGFVVTSGIVPGKVFGYGNISAFIPDTLPAPQKAQYEWLAAIEAEGTMSVLDPLPSTGDTLEVLQYYNNELYAQQINVYLSGPNMTSPWL